jgi:hypothetical protein
LVNSKPAPALGPKVLECDARGSRHFSMASKVAFELVAATSLSHSMNAWQFQRFSRDLLCI